MKFNSKPTNKDLYDYYLEKYNLYDFNYSNPGEIISFEGINKARKMLKNCNYPTILVDSDADGISSAAELVMYFEFVDKEYKIMVHKEKSHGIQSDELEEFISSNSDLLVVSDAGSNNISQAKKIIESGKKILILDHHIIEEENYYKINDMNTLSNYCLVSPKINKELSENLTGSTVVLETLKPLIDNRIYPVAVIGEIGDCGDTSDKYIHEMVNYGLNLINSNLFLDQFLEGNISQRDLSFSIIPIINSICRIGTEEQNIKLVKLLANVYDENQTKTYERRKKNKVTKKFEMRELELNEYANSAYEFPKIKAQQNKIVDKIVLNSDDNLIYNKSIIVSIYSEEDVDGNYSLSGLIATKLMNKYGKPSLVLFLDEKNKVYFGSGRSNIEKSYKDYLANLKVFDFVQGHDSAFGFQLKENKLNEFLNKVDENPFIDEIEEITVDIVRDKLVFDDVLFVEKNPRLFGGKFSWPKIGYQNIEFKKDNCYQKNKTIHLVNNNLEVILYKQNENRLYELINSENGFSDTIEFNFYGSPNINTFFGKKYQIVAENIEVSNNSKEDKITEKNIWF